VTSERLEILRLSGQSVLDDPVEVALLYSFAIHSHALVGFIWAARREPDDAIASDWMPSGK
jgi:hypothetical protein